MHDSQVPRQDSITIEKWRSALSRVANISGLDLEAFNGDEGELLLKLVEDVLKKVKKPQLNVARYPTGLDGKVEDFETTVSLHQHSGRVQVVGITGLGGVGKTTLAKKLFNNKSSKYKKSCFLFDVRETAKTSLLPLQKKLLKCLTESDQKIDYIDEGKEMLKKHLSELNPNLPSETVLLVLDDVDHVDQVHTLLPVAFKDILLTNSLILITSRDKGVLTRSGVQDSSIYKLIGLDTQCSTELFCSHAFCHPHPLLGFECLVDKFVRACQGLPLSLKVFGALLYGNTDKSYWVEELERLEEILPDDIQKSLQISYNALQKDEQQMFLDAACFLIGQNRETTIRIWEGSGWKGRRGLQSLLNKCLLELELEFEVGNRHPMHSTITMHDHLRDLGRQLAKDPKLPCRIWRGRGRIDDFLQQSSGVTDVRGIWMRHIDHNDDDELTSAFSSYEMRKLQLLHIEGVGPDPKVLHSPNLIWLRWVQYLGCFLPPIPLKKLWVLHVQGSNLETLWQDEMQAPSQLRELHIDAPLSNIPKSIGQLQHLEKVVVIGGNFEKLPEEICHLPSLKHLEFRDTPRLRSLPDSFGDLTNLEHIQLSDCSDLERLPISFGKLIKLKYLDLSGWFRLSLWSGSFGNIRTLENIDRSDCQKIEVLPSHIALQRSLKRSNLYLLNLREWPSAIGEPSGLGRLTQLRELVVSRCPELEELQGFEHLRSLEVLNASGCVKLNRIRCFAQLTQLRELDVSECSELEELQGFEHLRSLEVLNASRCVKLNRIRCSAQLTQLRELEVSYCSELEELQGFEHLRSLEVLNALSCVKLNRIRCSAQLTQLRQLEVSFCWELEELPGIEHLRSLEVLKAFQCVKLNRIRCSAQLTQLRELDVSECLVLEELPGFEHLSSLEVLNAFRCPKLKSIRCSVQLTQLRELDVSECSELEELPGFEHLSSLEELNASRCLKLKSIRCSVQLTQLRELDVSICSKLEELQGFEHLRSLEVLKASQCVKPKSLWGLSQLTQLRQLEVPFCWELEELPGFEHLRSLEVLKASYCRKLKSIRCSVQLTQLRELDVFARWELEELQGFEHLRSLEVLKASQCLKLKSLWGLSQLTQLRELDVSECPELEELQGFEHLRLLKASHCVTLKSLWGLSQLTELRTLEVMGLPMAVFGFHSRRNS